MIWKIRDRRLLFERTLLMGILNVTPDSFSDGGNFCDSEKAIAKALQIESDGADLLDIGAESTRPGAAEVSVEEELARLVPVLKGIQGKIRIPISIDTTKPQVARRCLEEGAHIINDVSGLKGSGPEMAETVAQFGAGLILMHRRGNPKTMQQMTDYQDVIEDVFCELRESYAMALACGLHEKQLVIDPGLGFSKTAEQNIEIIQRLERFHDLRRPVMIGPSRKSFIGKITGRETDEREFGTAAVVVVSVMKKVQIIRVHDINSMRDVVRMSEALEGENYVRA